MRDIVYKKVGAQSPEPVYYRPTPSKTKSPRLSRYIELAFETLNTAGGWLRQCFDREEQDVLIPAQQQPLTFPKAKKQRRVQEKLHSAAAKTKAKTGQAKRALKTPVGKMVIVNALTVAAILSYFAFAKGPATTTTLASATSVVQSKDAVRQYFPQPKQGVVEPFKEVNASVPHSSTTLNAWLTPWNLDQLSSEADHYHTMSAFWLTLADNGSDLIPKADWAAWQTFYKSRKDPQQKYYLTISANPDASYRALTSLDVQQKQIANLLQTVKDQHFDGIDIDYEGLGMENRELFTTFIRSLTAAFHTEKKLVAVTVEARIANQVPLDWHNLGLIADEVRVMAYDYHSHNTNFPGPVAPLSWVKEVTDYAVANINPSKVVIGLGNYGYDWVQNPDDPQDWEGNGLSFDQAVALSKDKNAPITQMTGIDDRGYDIGSIPNFTYKDDSGRQHSVWFEDKDSLQSKVNLVSQYPVQGIIFWSVGLGDQTFWTNTSPAN